MNYDLNGSHLTPALFRSVLNSVSVIRRLDSLRWFMHPQTWGEECRNFSSTLYISQESILQYHREIAGITVSLDQWFPFDYVELRDIVSLELLATIINIGLTISMSPPLATPHVPVPRPLRRIKP